MGVEVNSVNNMCHAGRGRQIIDESKFLLDYLYDLHNLFFPTLALTVTPIARYHHALKSFDPAPLEPFPQALTFYKATTIPHSECRLWT